MRMLRRTLDHLRDADAVAPSAAAPVTSSAAAAVEMPTDVAGVITPEEIRDFKGPSPFSWLAGEGLRFCPLLLCRGREDKCGARSSSGRWSGALSGVQGREPAPPLRSRRLAVGLIFRTQRTGTS